MTLPKSSFEYIKEMINNNDNVSGLVAFCEGYGIDINSYSSPVHISDEKISITYRRTNYYVTYNDSKIYGTTYHNKIN